MKNSNKQIIIILAITAVIIAAIVIAYVVMRKKSSVKITSISKVDNIEDNSGVTTLQYGSRGNEVKRLQSFLNQQLSLLVWKGLPTLNGEQIKELSTDGIFGIKTQAAVKWYFGKTQVTTNQF